MNLSTPKATSSVLIFSPEQAAEILPPAHPRYLGTPEELHALACSIAFSGQEQSATVERTEEGWRVVTGNRRLNAVLMINARPADFFGSDGKPLSGPVPFHAVERSYQSDDARVISVIDENRERKGLTPVDTGSLVVLLSDELGWTGEQVGAKLGLAKSRISQLRTLMSLPKAILDRVQRGELKEAAARALVPLKAAQRKALMKAMDDEGLTSAEVSRRASEAQRGEGKRSKRTMSELRNLLAQMSDESEQALVLLSWIDGVPGISMPDVELGKIKNREVVKKCLSESLGEVGDEGEAPKPKVSAKRSRGKASRQPDSQDEGADPADDSQEDPRFNSGE